LSREETSATASSEDSARAPRTHLARRVGNAEDNAEAAPGRVTREAARAGRMAPSRASATGVAHANGNAGLSAAGGSANALAGLTAGMTVKTASGATLGTIQRVERSASGTVRSVLVKTADGGRRLLHLAPHSLTVSGDVVTTTESAASLRG
jgi:hypothetical protein